MRPCAPHARALFCVSVASVFLLFAAGWSQTGTVLTRQKISDTEGGFLEPLGNADEFGGAVAELGDLDGAGPSVAAVAIGAVGDDDGGSSRGAVYVLFLDATGGVLSYQKISDTVGGFAEPLANADEFGSSLADLGDLDGAGPSVAALAVGTIGDDDGGTDRGAVYVLFLDAGGLVLSYQKISDTVGGFAEPLANADELGGTVAFLGDLDGAGPAAAALAVGAVGDDDGGTDRGAVYVMFLAASGNVLSYQKISDTAGGFTEPLSNTDEFGSSVAWLGDLDGQGPAAGALAVGAIGDDDGGTNHGAVYVLFLNSGGLVLSHQKISDTQGGFNGVLADDDEFGGAVASVEDLDGPGGSAVTLSVGCALSDDGGLDRGCTWMLFLDSGGNVLSHGEISDTSGDFGGGVLADEDQFASSVVCVGDLDGAGPCARTLVAGAVGDDDGGTDRGAVYVLFLDGYTTSDAPSLLPASRLGSLGRAAPNPFRPLTAIPYSLARSARVQIDVRDVAGRLVRKLVDGTQAAGEHRAEWDGADDAGRRVAAGTYFYRMTVDGRTRMGAGKISLLR
jgi:hypothetical protein